MFSRFGPAAKRILRGAEQAARNHNHYYVGVGHLLLALIEESDPAIEAQLRERGIRRDIALAQARRALGTGDDRLWEGILITPRVRAVVARAEEGLDEGAELAPVDLFHALAEEEVGLAAEVLAGSRCDPSPQARA
ncbi:MAG: Clp protease N-terminal domain-containing protein [Vulcanimicrobiaceae bacterium]